MARRESPKQPIGLIAGAAAAVTVLFIGAKIISARMAADIYHGAEQRAISDAVLVAPPAYGGGAVSSIAVAHSSAVASKSRSSAAVRTVPKKTAVKTRTVTQTTASSAQASQSTDWSSGPVTPYQNMPWYTDAPPPAPAQSSAQPQAGTVQSELGVTGVRGDADAKTNP